MSHAKILVHLMLAAVLLAGCIVVPFPVPGGGGYRHGGGHGGGHGHYGPSPRGPYRRY
jgi:hypothetical protein